MPERPISLATIMAIPSTTAITIDPDVARGLLPKMRAKEIIAKTDTGLALHQQKGATATEIRTDLGLASRRMRTGDEGCKLFDGGNVSELLAFHLSSGYDALYDYGVLRLIIDSDYP